MVGIIIRAGSSYFLKGRKEVEFVSHILEHPLAIRNCDILFNPNEIHDHNLAGFGYAFFMPMWEAAPVCDNGVDHVEILISNYYWGVGLENSQVLIAKSSDVKIIEDKIV